MALAQPFVDLAPQHDSPVDPDTVPPEDFFRVECGWESEIAAFIDFASRTTTRIPIESISPG